MERRSTELAGPLEILPPVDFCCAYGSFLLPNNTDKTAMVDYILGVQDPIQWHQENLERNRDHYSKWMARLGPKTITRISDGIGVGVHFNPFVEWRDKMIKYGVVRMQDLAWDVLTWEKFYLSGRLQKPVRWCLRNLYMVKQFTRLLKSGDPVHILIDHWDIRKVNLVNLKAATSVALLLLPAKFTEEDLYVKICSLSYMGDLRMLFAEDKDKVKKIVEGSFSLFQSMYKPFLAECAAEGLLKVYSNSSLKVFQQDCGLSSTSSLFSSLPATALSRTGVKLSTEQPWTNAGGAAMPQTIKHSRQKVMNSVQKVLRRIVMVSSARQAVSGILAAGGTNAARYLTKKLSKAWKSRTS